MHDLRQAKIAPVWVSEGTHQEMGMIWHDHHSVQIEFSTVFLQAASRTMFLASGGSCHLWSVVNVMKIGRMSF
jgi:hypothetical protein